MLITPCRKIAAVAAVSLIALCGAAAVEYRPEAWNLQARERFAAHRYGVFIVWGLYANYAQGEWYLQHGRLDRDAYERMVQVPLALRVVCVESPHDEHAVAVRGEPLARLEIPGLGPVLRRGRAKRGRRESR